MPTKKNNPAATKLQQLIERIQSLENEDQEVHRQLQQAMRERYELEREIRRAEKPTPAMMAVLQAITSGGKLSSYEYNYPYRRSVRMPGGEKVLTVKESVFSGLISREAITEESRGVMRREYQITDHGKALVKLEDAAK